jgi:hypothetical protein
MPVGTDAIVSAKSEKKEKEEQSRIIQSARVQFAKTVRGIYTLGVSN